MSDRVTPAPKKRKKEFMRARRTPKVNRTDSPTAAKRRAVRWTRCYWATMGPRQLPCIWGRKRDAEEQKEVDERVIRVRIQVIRNG